MDLQIHSGPKELRTTVEENNPKEASDEDDLQNSQFDGKPFYPAVLDNKENCTKEYHHDGYQYLFVHFATCFSKPDLP